MATPLLATLGAMQATGVQEDQRPHFYERFADEFDERMNRYEVAKRLRLVFDEGLGDLNVAGRELLDAGCGTGLFSQVATERGARVTSLDVGDALLAQVARKCNSVRVVGDVTAMPFDPDSFDVVICTEVIEHTLDPERAVAELARVLRPGGRLVVTTPNRAWRWSVTVAGALRLRPYHGLENWLSWTGLARAARTAGLRIRGMRGFNAFPWIHPATYRTLDRLDRLGTRRIGRQMINVMLVAEKPLDAG